MSNNKDNHEVMSDAIIEWLEIYKENKHMKSDNMLWLTWEESATQFISKVLND